MKPTIVLLAATITLSPAVCDAAFMELVATEIVSIESTDTTKGSRILVKWDLPARLDSLVIDGAGIVMDVPRSGTGPALVGVYPLTKSWSSGTVGWSDGWEEQGGDFDVFKMAPALLEAEATAQVKTDVSETIKAMIADEITNHGFILVLGDDTKARLSVVSANSSTYLAKARLVIAYRQRR